MAHFAYVQSTDTQTTYCVAIDKKQINSLKQGMLVICDGFEAHGGLALALVYEPFLASGDLLIEEIRYQTGCMTGQSFCWVVALDASTLELVMSGKGKHFPANGIVDEDIKHIWIFGHDWRDQRISYVGTTTPITKVH